MTLNRRSWLALCAFASAPAFAQDEDEPRRLILDANRALQAANPARFMSYFDQEQFAQFSVLRRAVTALTEARTIATSVDILSLSKETDGWWSARVDWLLQLTPISSPGEVETRQETVLLDLVQNPKLQWRIVAFEPIDLFRVL